MKWRSWNFYTNSKAFRRKMHAVGIASYRDIDAIVDDEPRAMMRADFAQLARELQQVASAEIFFAQLNRDAPSKCLRRR